MGGVVDAVTDFVGDVYDSIEGEVSRAYDRLEDEVNRSYDDFENGVQGAITGSWLGPMGMVSGFMAGSGLAGSIMRDFGEIAGALGLNSLEREFKRMGRDVDQIGDMMNGDFKKAIRNYERKKEQAEAYQEYVKESYERFNAELDEFSDRLTSLVAFGEIFHLAISNRMKVKIDEREPELKTMADRLDELIEELNTVANNLKENYDFALGLVQTNGWITKFVVSMTMVMEGLSRDFLDIARGETDGTTWKNFGRGVLALVAMVVAVLVSVKDGGQSLALVVAAVATTILSLMTLDGLYGGGIATNGFMSMLDFLFNDILNSDEWISNKMDRLDPDHEEHQKMVVVIQLLLTVTAISAYIYNAWTAPTPPPAKVEAPTSYLGGAVKIGNTIQTSSVLGVSFTSLWNTFQIAMSVNDYLKAKEAYDEMKKKLDEARASFETEITAHVNKRMMGHYKDSAYFLQDQQEFIDRYIWSMTASSMYVDPYGTTPVANMRFMPDKDTRMMSFGFEDVFSEETAAGSKAYFNSIIYGS